MKLSLKLILFVLLLALPAHAEDLFNQGSSFRVLVKCELTRDIPEAAPGGGRPFEVLWGEGMIEAEFRPSADTGPHGSYDGKSINPGEFLFNVSTETAKKQPHMVISLKRTQRFPYEGKVVRQLKEDEIRSGEVTVQLKLVRKFTRRVARYLRHKETGKPVTGVEISLMKYRADGFGANQVDVTTTDAEGFFHFLIWDDWKYSVSPRASSDNFGIVNEPSKEVIDWIPNNVFEEN